VPDELVNVRYMVDDVDQAIDLFTTHFRLHAPHPKKKSGALASSAPL
jgi:hypothetical protein